MNRPEELDRSQTSLFTIQYDNKVRIVHLRHHPVVRRHRLLQEQGFQSRSGGNGLDSRWRILHGCGDEWPWQLRDGDAVGVAMNPRGPDSPFDPSEPNEKKRVHRGGSFLCNDQYCSRYIVGTRGKGEVNTGTNHLGFRCVNDAGIKTAGN